MDSEVPWTTPGAYEVADGVFRIPLSLPDDGLRAVNVYLIQTPGGPVLIDSGWAHGPARTELESALRGLGYSFGDIDRLLITHLHFDHYTLGAQIREEFGTPIWLPIGERASIERILEPGSLTLDAQMHLLRTHGAGTVADALEAAGAVYPIDTRFWTRPDEWISPGDVLDFSSRRLTTIPTPGHTNGHVSFADLDNGLLFAGDHVLPHITPSIGFQTAPTTTALQDFLESLRVVTRLPDLRLLPAHGWPCETTHDRALALLAHHEQRLSDTEDAVNAGASSAHEVARRLFWTGRRRRFADLDLFNQMLATIETVAHLELLAETERVGVVSGSGDERYEPVRAPARGA